MNQQEAQQIAREYIQSILEDVSMPIEILADQSVEKPYGWIFFYQSKRYLDTGAIADMLVRNGPILVNKSGKVIHLPSAIPVDESIRRYEAGLPILPRPNAQT